MRIKYLKGFTLIELLIATVIVAIIAAFAYPAYQGSIRKSRRADAKSALVETAQILERCFSRLDKYDDTACPDTTYSIVSAGPTINIKTGKLPLTGGGGYYTISSIDADDTERLKPTTFELRATPTAKNGQNNDTHCASFTLNNLGVKGATNTDCW